VGDSILDQTLKASILVAIVVGIVNIMVKSVEIKQNKKNAEEKMKLEGLLDRNKKIEQLTQDFLFGVDLVCKSTKGFASASIRVIHKELGIDQYQSIITKQQDEINKGMETTFRTITSIKLLIANSEYKEKIIELLEKCRENIEEAATETMDSEYSKYDLDCMESLAHELENIGKKTQKNVDDSIDLLNKYFNEDPF
jgi:hypothetical protein